MEILDSVKIGDKLIEQLWGNGQCKCDKCGTINWTSWCYHYGNKTICSDCLKHELEEDMIVAHASTEQNKLLYADRHLRILELQREERKDLKNIIKSQSDEMKLNEFYNKHFVKRGQE